MLYTAIRILAVFAVATAYPGTTTDAPAVAHAVDSAAVLEPDADPEKLELLKRIQVLEALVSRKPADSEGGHAVKSMGPKRCEKLKKALREKTLVAVGKACAWEEGRAWALGQSLLLGKSRDSNPRAQSVFD